MLPNAIMIRTWPEFRAHIGFQCASTAKQVLMRNRSGKEGSLLVGLRVGASQFRRQRKLESSSVTIIAPRAASMLSRLVENHAGW